MRTMLLSNLIWWRWPDKRATCAAIMNTYKHKAPAIQQTSLAALAGQTRGADRVVLEMPSPKFFFPTIIRTLLFSRVAWWRWPDKRAERFGLSLIFCFFCIKAKEKAKTERKNGNSGVFHFQRKAI